MEQLQSHIWLTSSSSGNIEAFPHILGSPSSYMTLQLLHSVFSHIWWKFSFLCYQCNRMPKRLRKIRISIFLPKCSCSCLNAHALTFWPWYPCLHILLNNVPVLLMSRFFLRHPLKISLLFYSVQLQPMEPQKLRDSKESYSCGGGIYDTTKQ